MKTEALDNKRVSREEREKLKQNAVEALSRWREALKNPGDTNAINVAADESRRAVAAADAAGIGEGEIHMTMKG
jgi:hypothetical protein